MHSIQDISLQKVYLHEQGHNAHASKASAYLRCSNLNTYNESWEHTHARKMCEGHDSEAHSISRIHWTLYKIPMCAQCVSMQWCWTLCSRLVEDLFQLHTPQLKLPMASKHDGQWIKKTVWTSCDCTPLAWPFHVHFKVGMLIARNKLVVLQNAVTDDIVKSAI